MNPEKSAVISECGKYRYTLSRKWGEGGTCCFVMLNPSTADADVDDPTIRRCMRFAASWGYGELVVVNLFAFRSPSPTEMKRQFSPIGSKNDEWIQDAVLRSKVVVCAWGKDGAFLNRGERVLKDIRVLGVQPCYLKLNGDGHPGHPLYLRGDLQPRKFGVDT